MMNSHLISLAGPTFMRNKQGLWLYTHAWLPPASVSPKYACIITQTHMPHTTHHTPC